MASVWLVTVLFAVQVFANNKFESCDSCIRHGGTWCSSDNQRCELSPSDDWCPNNQEKAFIIPNVNVGIDKRIQHTILIGAQTLIEIPYDSNINEEITHNIVNSTQDVNAINIDEFSNRCTKNKRSCTAKIAVKLDQSFCSSTSGINETIYVNFTIANLNEHILAKFHVPCACKCSYFAEPNSMKCSGNGNYSCGVCICEDGWSGDHCESQKECDDVRYDSGIGCKNPNDKINCSGNGKCTQCNQCKCFNDRKGSQYFSIHEFCADLCMLTADWEGCFFDNTFGKCIDNEAMIFKQYNESLVSQRDELGRYIWVHCNELMNEIEISYVVMKVDDKMIIMTKTNEMHTAAHQSTKVGWIAGAVVLAALLCAVAAAVMYRTLSAAKPPLCETQYGHIEGEYPVHDNVTYKDPITRYTNPIYNKG